MKELFLKWAQETDNLGLFQEMGDRGGWEACSARCRELEEEIFRLTGQRPPYGKGWGPLFAEVGFDPTSR